MSVEFRLELAGCRIGVRAQHEAVRDFCRDYLTAAEPELRVEVSSGDIAFERKKAVREAVREGHPAEDWSDAYLETLAVYRKIAEALTARDTLLFHGSAVAVDGQAYLFTAGSGTGKSTHTGLWRELFGERAVMINDDKPLLRLAPEGITVCGTPWDGKHHLSTNIAVPLRGLCLLYRGETNRIRPITRREAYPMLLQQSYRPADPAAMLKTLELVDRLSDTAALYRLECNMEREAARIAYEGMNA